MRAEAPIPVILDVDTGVDDACALLLAALHPNLELRAVTCVVGNTSLPQVAANTLTVLDVCDRRDVPVAAGATRPLLADPDHAGRSHGDDGMADLPLPRSRRAPYPGHAVELLRDVLSGAIDAPQQERITLVALGPLTTVALLLRSYPEIAGGIRRLVVIAGTTGEGEASHAAGFNALHDPEAAGITLAACADLGIDVTLYGLDVFFGPLLSRTQAAALSRSAVDTPTGLAGRLMEFQCERFDQDRATIGDAGAVCSVLAPELVRTERLPVQLAGSSRGPMIVDLALEIDGAACADLWLRTVASPTATGRAGGGPRSGGPPAG